MTDLAAARAKPSLPQQWVEEMALSNPSLPALSASASPPRHSASPVVSASASLSARASSPPNTLGGPLFDRQLDGFLDRFQEQIHGARALKDHLDRCSPDHPDYLSKKLRFKLKMDHIRALFSTEGEDFVASLERRNPHLSIAVCGENTIELAQGIDRLESAVREEETKRAAFRIPPRPDLTVSTLTASSADHHISPPKPPADRPVAPPIPVTAVGHTLNNLTSDETLQLMQSDIQALKLELMRLQRSKVPNPSPFPTSNPHSLPTRPLSAAIDSPSTSPYSVPSLTPDNTSPSRLPPSLLANNNVNVVRVSGRATTITPTYVSHLEQMKSRIEALEKKPLSRRAKSVARLGRTQTMGSMYEASPPMTADENQHPNVCAIVTPPRNLRRSKHRSISTSSPLAPLTRRSPPIAARMSVHTPRASSSPTVEVTRVGGADLSSPASTPSPKRSSLKPAEGAPGRGSSRYGPPPNSGGATSPARLFFDAPEEMLARPQSHAAARDIQRYSLKVARRFVPVGAALDRGDGSIDGSSVAGSTTKNPAIEDTSVSARSRSHEGGGAGGGHPHTLSDIGTTTTGGAGAPSVGASTMETSGSGGRVVEEIEGDMWVRKGLVWKRWRRRYASIVSHQFFGKVMCLFSYDSSGGVISTRSQIVVLHGSLCRGCKDGVEISGKQRFMFQLRTSSKEYYFAAESEEERRNWIKELRDAARVDNGRAVGKTKGGRSMTLRRRNH